MRFHQHVNPGAAIGDFAVVFRQAGRNRWRIALLSAALTVGIFSVMAQESWRIPRPKPEVVYINSWPLDRTEQETRAFIAENQKRKEELEKLNAERERVGRELWSGLGRASGMDVDKIAAEAEAQRAAEAAKARAAAEALIEPEQPPVER